MNQTIATGHVMRCLAIADELASKKIKSIFVLADSNAQSLIQDKGYECVVLNTIWNDMDFEINAITELIQNRNITKLLIDTYQVTEKYLSAIYCLTHVIYLDDINLFLYPVHTLVCYANYWKKFDYENRFKQALDEGIVDKVPQMYLGCEYVPLRREFRNAYTKVINNKIEELLVMSGGADPHHAIKKILTNICVGNYSNINVICGRYNCDYDNLIDEYKDCPNVHIYKSVNNLIDFMKSADVAISAGGTTLYELCAIGTPTITYSIADNQLDNVRQFELDGVMVYAGDLRGESEIDFEAVIQKYNLYKRIHMSHKMKNVVGQRGRWDEIVSN